VEQLVPDPNSPHRSKILLGLNFYGQDFTPNGGGAILGNQFIELLKKAKPSEKMRHDETAEENFIEIR
jgi:chitinase domain-containing protein 1